MGIDIRLPLGLLFACVGLLLTLFGIASDPTIYGVSLGVNINLVWGLVMLVVGLIVVLSGWRRRPGNNRFTDR